MNKGENWYFTFGSGQVHDGRYVKIFGTFESARKEMFNRFGRKWSFQYSEKEWTAPQDHWKEGAKTMAENWDWRELK